MAAFNNEFMEDSEDDDIEELQLAQYEDFRLALETDGWHMGGMQDDSLLGVLQRVFQGNIQHGEFLAMIATYVRNNWEDIHDLVQGDSLDATDLRIRDGQWDGRLENRAAANIFQTNIIVHMEDLERQDHPYDLHFARTVHIARFYERWFNLWMEDEIPDQNMEQLPEELPHYDGLFKSTTDKHLEVLIMIPKVFYADGDSLLQCIEKTNKFFYLFDWTGNQRLLIQKNIEMDNTFVIFIAFHRMRENRDIREKPDWIAENMLFHLMTSTMKFTWRDKQVDMLSKCNNANCMIFTLVKSKWAILRTSIMEDFELVLDLADFHFCVNCGDECEVRDKNWHVNFVDAARLTMTPTDTSPLFQTLKLFDGYFSTKKRMIKFLNRIYSAFSALSPEAKMERFIRALDLHHLAGTNNTFFCYTILVVDDKGQTENFEEENLQEILANDAIRKEIYVGVTKDKVLRLSHFKKGSPVFDSLSPTARIFLIRSNEHLTRSSGELEEGIAIEFLKLRKDVCRVGRKKPTITVLNKNSSTGVLKQLTSKRCKELWSMVNNIGDRELDIQFAEAGLGVDYDFNPVFENLGEIEIPDGEYMNRDYAEVDVAYFSFVKNFINARS